MGYCKNSIWVAGKLFWYQQQDFLTFTREFSEGKLKQKGFFHSVKHTNCKNLLSSPQCKSLQAISFTPVTLKIHSDNCL
jgi:hypothetical protein